MSEGGAPFWGSHHRAQITGPSPPGARCQAHDRWSRPQMPAPTGQWWTKRGKYRDRERVIFATEREWQPAWEKQPRQQGRGGDGDEVEPLARWLLVSSLIQKTDMSCCFILFVTCPEIAGVETALHFSDCRSRSCGHRNSGCLPRFFSPLVFSQTISYSSPLWFPHLCPRSLTCTSLPEAMTRALLGSLWLTPRPLFLNPDGHRLPLSFVFSPPFGFWHGPAV